MKILVLGPPASGKTELARQLAQRYGSAYLEPDEIVKNHVDGIVSFLATHTRCVRRA